MQIKTLSGEIHNVKKYIIDTDGEESIWCDTWYGRHVIGQDCNWYAEPLAEAQKEIERLKGLVINEYMKHEGSFIGSLLALGNNYESAESKWANAIERFKQQHNL